jgi:1,4-dihydroxy-2-naphthoate octaprenyltransferase
MAATFLTIVGLWLADIYPLWALVGLVPAVIAVKAVKVVLEKRKDFRDLVPAQAMTIQVHLLVGVLLVVGYIAAGLL